MGYTQQMEWQGTWNLIDFKMVMEEETNHKDEAALKSEGAIWDLIFMDENAVEQRSNMRTGELESWEGRYLVDEDTLNLFLKVEGREMQLQYKYRFIESELHLKRSNPKGNMHVLTVFRKASV